MSAVGAEYGPFVLPDDGHQKGFATEIAAFRMADLPHAQQNRPPFPAGRFDQVGMADTADGLRAAQMPVGDQGIARIRLIGAQKTAAAEDGDAVVLRGAALGDEQIVPAANMVEVRPLRAFGAVQRAVRAQNVPLAQECSCQIG